MPGGRLTCSPQVEPAGGRVFPADMLLLAASAGLVYALLRSGRRVDVGVASSGWSAHRPGGKAADAGALSTRAARTAPTSAGGAGGTWTTLTHEHGNGPSYAN